MSMLMISLFRRVLFTFFCLVTVIQRTKADENSTTKNNDNDDRTSIPKTFIIKVGSLNKIFHRSTDDGCDTERIFGPSVQSLEMLHHTFDEINANASFLPGIKIVLNATADCVVDTIALRQIVKYYIPSYEFLTNNNSYWGIIGPQSSEVSVPTARLLGLFKTPQISYGATSPVLSNKQRYPYFFRTAASDTNQVEAIIDLLIFNKWLYVSFIYDDDDYGTGAYDTFRAKAVRTPICLAFTAKLPRTLKRRQIAEYVQLLIENTKSNVVILFVNQVHFSLILDQIIKNEVETRFQFIGSDLIHGIEVREVKEYLKDSSNEKKLHSALNGAITYGPSRGVANEDFEKYIRSLTLKESLQHNPYYAPYLASLGNCTLNETVANHSNLELCEDDMTMPTHILLSSLVQPAHDAAIAFATAIRDAQNKLCSAEDPLCKEFFRLSGKSFRNYIKNVSFASSNGIPFHFDGFNDGPAIYDILRYDGLKINKWVKIGQYRNGSIPTLKTLKHFGFRGRGGIESVCGQVCADREYMLYQEEEKQCCWQCVECPENSIVKFNYSIVRNTSSCYDCGEDYYASGDGCIPIPLVYLSFDESWGWVVTIFSAVGLVFTLFTCALFIQSWDTAIVRASGRELSFIMLFGLLLAFISSFFFTFRPNRGLCGLRRLTAGSCFTLIYASLLVKTMRISIIFNNYGKHMVRDMKTILRPLPLVLITMLVTGIELFVLAIWLFLQPPEVMRAKALQKTMYQDFLDCRGLRSNMFIFCLCYPILLVLITALWAIKIRKVPAGFNEAKHIVFAVYITLVIWLAQVSTFVANTPTNIILRDALYCLGLSLNGLIILFAIFGPKVYIIMFRPAKNNQNAVMAIPSRTSIGSFSVQNNHVSSCSTIESDSYKEIETRRKTHAHKISILRSLYFNLEMSSKLIVENAHIKSASTESVTKQAEAESTDGSLEICDLDNVFETIDHDKHNEGNNDNSNNSNVLRWKIEGFNNQAFRDEV